MARAAAALERLSEVVTERRAEARAGAAEAARVAVLIPCYNEETAAPLVVKAFREALPDATVYVYDNNSTDRTSEVAAEAGAVVRRARRQGKGNVVRQMFSDVEADIYVLVDGDATYDAAAAPRLIGYLVHNELDMVCGARVTTEQAAYRLGHRLGNRVLTGLVREVFGREFKDMLTGYRVFSRRFVKSFPAASSGFETETELTVHALQMRLPTEEYETVYRARPEGSTSKLNSIRDGIRILRMIGLLVREERPLQFFGAIAAVAVLLAGLLAWPVAAEYFQTGLVPRFPTLIVAVALGVTGLLSLACGLILDTVSRARLEQRRLAYLGVSGPGALKLKTP
jgi:glycosyltransferase involved in cell wall biosynthesis